MDFYSWEMFFTRVLLLAPAAAWYVRHDIIGVWRAIYRPWPPFSY